MTKCEVPPAGWYCTRPAGHDGPCAAHPDAPTRPKQYMLFGYYKHEPGAGWHDFIGSFNTLDEAIAEGVRRVRLTWPNSALIEQFHVVDLNNEAIVAHHP